ncbi:MAG TPA: HEAT repeat domain-containing protein [Nitrospiria bacterium]|jgi:HEAT repeat protein|nr:HEAT repeat domain-containing protein [Nitrospiria bacterium]
MDAKLPEPIKSSDPDSKVDTDVEIDKEELKSVKEVLLQLTKTAKTLKIYLPNNPIYQRFLQELQIRFDSHLRAHETLRLKIKQYAIYYKGQPVYENTNRLESLAFKLSVDGVREVTFFEGIDKDEITSLLEIIGREYDPSNPDDDMVTLLWERHFTHINYLVADDFIQEAIMPIRPQEAATFEKLVEKEKPTMNPVAAAQTTIQEYLGPKLADQSSEIFVLSEEEIASIKQQIKVEKFANPISTLVGILATILRIEKDDAAFSEMVEILDSVLETLMLRGDFWHSKKILQLFRELLEPQRNLPEIQRLRLMQAIDRAGDPQRIHALEPVLNQWGAKETDQVYEFWLLLNKNALLPLIELLGLLTQMKMRRVICEALIHLGHEDIEPLIQKLDDPRWFVVRNVVYVLGKIGRDKVLENFRKLIDHQEVKVRKELLHTLDGMKDHRAKELLVRFLNDPESSLRILALRSLTSHNYLGALEPLKELIEGRDFAFRDLYEKKEIFEALGKMGGSSMVPKMRKLVRQGGAAWFKKAIKEEMGLCAVLTLKRIGTEDAMAVLKEGQNLSSKVIREACAKALNEIGRSHGS